MAPALSKVAAGSSSQPPKTASEPDCTAKHADALIVRTRLWPRNGANGPSFAFPRSVACVQRQAAGLRTPARWATITAKGEYTGPKHGNETSTWHVRGPLLIAHRTQQLGHNAMSVVCQFNFNREPPFLRGRLSYMRDLPPERADNPGANWRGWWRRSVIPKSRSDT